MTLKRTSLAALLLLSVVVGAFAGAAAAASNGSITADPRDPGATAIHLATATVDSGGPWDGFAVSYEAGDASNVGANNIVTVGIDRGDDASGDTIDVDVSDAVSDVSSSDGGRTLTIALDGSYDLADGDEVVVEYGDVVNPDAEGSYDVTLDVNPRSSGGETAAALAITSSDTTTTQTTTQTATQTTSGGTTERTTASDTTTTRTTTQTTTGTTERTTTSSGTTTQTTAGPTQSTTTSETSGTRAITETTTAGPGGETTSGSSGGDTTAADGDGTTTGSGGDGSSGGSPGFGVAVAVAAVAAVVGGALLAGRD